MSFNAVALLLLLLCSCGVKDYPIPPDDKPFRPYDQKFRKQPDGGEG